MGNVLIRKSLFTCVLDVCVCEWVGAWVGGLVYIRLPLWRRHVCTALRWPWPNDFDGMILSSKSICIRNNSTVTFPARVDEHNRYNQSCHSYNMTNIVIHITALIISVLKFMYNIYWIKKKIKQSLGLTPMVSWRRINMGGYCQLCIKEISQLKR